MSENHFPVEECIEQEALIKQKILDLTEASIFELTSTRPLTTAQQDQLENAEQLGDKACWVYKTLCKHIKSMEKSLTDEQILELLPTSCLFYENWKLLYEYGIIHAELEVDRILSL